MSRANRRRYIIIALAVSIIIVIALTYFLLAPKETEYISMYEFYTHEEYAHWLATENFREGVTFHIRDTVLRSSSVELSSIIVGSDPSDISFDLFNSTVLTYVSFESLLDRDVGFLGDLTDQFQPGEEVEFRMETKEYSAPWYFGVENPNRTLVEPVYVYLVSVEYSLAHAGNEYSISDLEVCLVNNSTELQATVNYVADYTPMPFGWGNVTVGMCEELNCFHRDADPSVRVYDHDGSLLGVLSSNSPNASISASIEPDQYLLLSYDPQYSSHFLVFGALGMVWGHVQIP